MQNLEVFTKDGGLQGPFNLPPLVTEEVLFSYFFCKWMPYAIFHYTDFTLGTVIKSFPVVLFSTAVALVVITTVSRYRPLHPSPNPLFPQKLINHSNSVQTFHKNIHRHTSYCLSSFNGINAEQAKWYELPLPNSFVDKSPLF